jgi:phasin
MGEQERVNRVNAGWLCSAAYIAMHNGIDYIYGTTGSAMPVFSPDRIFLEEKIVAYTDDIFSFSAFDPAKLTQSWREFAETSTTHSRDAYGKMKTAAEEASRTVESTIHSAQAGSMEFGLKAIDAFRTNTEMSLSHMEQLIGAKSFSEVMELQTAFVRKQAEFTVEQVKVMQEAAQKVAGEVSRPGKEAAEKVMEAFRPA